MENSSPGCTKPGAACPFGNQNIDSRSSPALLALPYYGWPQFLWISCTQSNAGRLLWSVVLENKIRVIMVLLSPRLCHCRRRSSTSSLRYWWYLWFVSILGAPVVNYPLDLDDLTNEELQLEFPLLFPLLFMISVVVFRRCAAGRHQRIFERILLTFLQVATSVVLEVSTLLELIADLLR